jgi:hypothetical protein
MFFGDIQAKKVFSHNPRVQKIIFLTLGTKARFLRHPFPAQQEALVFR